MRPGIGLGANVTLLAAERLAARAEAAGASGVWALFGEVLRAVGRLA